MCPKDDLVQIQGRSGLLEILTELGIEGLGCAVAVEVERIGA